MRTQPPDELIEAIYAAPMEGGGWHNAMRLLHERYGSNMEALYFLDFAERRTRVIELQGVTSGWLHQFNPLYFHPDNPWARYTAQLHRVRRRAWRDSPAIPTFFGAPPTSTNGCARSTSRTRSA